MAIQSLSQLPFPKRDSESLFGFSAASDLEDGSYGYCFYDGVLTLRDRHSQSVQVERPLIFGLHNYDLDDPQHPELALEFMLGAGESAQVFVARLDLFWQRIGLPLLEKLPHPPQDLVLALCNPLQKQLTKPPSLAATRLHYALGDVEAWLDAPSLLQASVRLQANTWRLAR